MVLSDLGNSPDRLAEAAVGLALAGRVAHIAGLGQAHDDEGREFWERVIAALPATSSDEADYLPGVSRLVSETGLAGLGRGPLRVWLRTSYRR
jgi:hypothetical protein